MKSFECVCKKSYETVAKKKNSEKLKSKRARVKEPDSARAWRGERGEKSLGREA
jgi:hypothetical protein